METEIASSDLLALTKLYALLSRAGDGSLSEASELLDEKARLLLKNLLDGAAERVLRNHSEIVASQLGVSNAKCCSQIGQNEETLNSAPCLSPEVSKHVNDVSQITSKYSNSHAISLQKDKQPIVKTPTENTVPAVLKRNISLNRNNCRACEWSSMGQQKVLNLNNQGQQIHVNDIDFFEQKRGNADNFLRSNEEAARNVPSPSWRQRVRSPSIDDWALSQTQKPVIGRDSLHGRLESVSRRCESPSRTPARWVNSYCVESPSPLASQKSNYVRGLRVPLSRDDVAKKPPASPIVMDSSVRKSMSRKGTYGKDVKSRAPTPPHSVRTMASDKHDHKLTRNVPKETEPRRNKDVPHRRIISPTLLDHKSGQIQERSSTDSNSYGSPRKIMPYERDTSASSSPYSQISSSFGESEAYSSTSWTSQQTSHRYGKSKAYSPPSQTEARLQVGHISKRRPKMASDGSSCSERSHRRNVKHSIVSSSPKQQQVKTEKGSKGLRKVKHMFGFIFHPFHKNDDQAKERPPKSNWKRVQKMLPRKAEAGDSKAIQVSRKSAGAKGTVKNQTGNVWGMLAVHVRKAKKPKGGGLGGNKNVAKKLNYWQKLHNRTKVKLPNKRNPLTRRLTLLEHKK